MFKTVLFPIDQSRDSQEAAETVAKLVKHFDSRLTILSVEESEGADPQGTAAIDALLNSAQSTFSGWSISAETLHRQGKAAFTICDVADEIKAELIIMGCRGIGLMQEDTAESVSSRVINLAPCPVLVVP